MRRSRVLRLPVNVGAVLVEPLALR